MITAITHIAYNTANMDEMVDFYVNKLGFEKAFKMEQDGKLWIQYIKIAEGQFIELFNEEKVGGNIFGDRYNHIALLSDDIKAEVERLRGLGVEIVYDVAMGGDNTWQAWIADPDSNRVELMQFTDKSLQLQ